MKTLLMTAAAALMLSAGAASAATSSYALSAQALAAQSAAAQPDFYGTVWHDEGVSTATGGPVGAARG